MATGIYVFGPKYFPEILGTGAFIQESFKKDLTTLWGLKIPWDP